MPPDKEFLRGDEQKGGVSEIDRERTDSQTANAQTETVPASLAGGSRAEENPSERQEKNPAITNPRWENADGNTITKALVGDEVYLCAEVTDIDDGATAKIKIVEKDDDGNDDDLTVLTDEVQGSKIRCDWKVIYTEDNDDAESQKEMEEKGYTLPEYAFTVECGGEKSTESGQLDIKDEIEIIVSNFDKLKGKTLRLSWKDGSSKSITIASQKLIVKDIFIGTAKIKII